jgi:hypothetical protein
VTHDTLFDSQNAAYAQAMFEEYARNPKDAAAGLLLKNSDLPWTDRRLAGRPCAPDWARLIPVPKPT